MPPDPPASLHLSSPSLHHHLWLSFTRCFRDVRLPGSGLLCEPLCFFLADSALLLIPVTAAPCVAASAWPRSCAHSLDCWKKGRQENTSVFSAGAQSASCGHRVTVKLKQILAVNPKASAVKGRERKAVLEGLFCC